MAEFVAPGLAADWLNAWLAAIGVTVLLPDVRLGWTGDPVPKARFSFPGGSPLAERIAESLPTVDQLKELVIADLPQNLSASEFSRAAAQARERLDLSLALLTTDIGGLDKRKGTLPTGPFNPGAPHGETLFTRLRACRQGLDVLGDLPALVDASLTGRGQRVEANGLGFDYRRIAASVPGEAPKWVDPVVECLCFFGLFLHPLSGNGRRPRQRGWAGSRGSTFRWPVWENPLDRWAIDALLDVVYADLAVLSSSIAPLPGSWRRLSVSALFGAVPFQRTGPSDPTRGYASERLA